MRDIEDFRTDIDAVIVTEKKRFKNPQNAEKVLEFDLLWRKEIK